MGENKQWHLVEAIPSSSLYRVQLYAGRCRLHCAPTPTAWCSRRRGISIRGGDIVTGGGELRGFEDAETPDSNHLHGPCSTWHGQGVTKSCREHPANRIVVCVPSSSTSSQIYLSNPPQGTATKLQVEVCVYSFDPAIARLWSPITGRDCRHPVAKAC